MDSNNGDRPGTPQGASERTEGKRRNDTMVVPSLQGLPTRPRAAAFDETEPASDLPMVESVKDSKTLRSRVIASNATVDETLDDLRKSPFSRLVVETRAAAGGMGAIDVAVDHALQRRIAVKTLHPHLRTNDLALRMFLREARLTSLLDHPHIVPIYDIGETDAGELYFTMKLVDGRTLADLVAALPKGPLDTSALYTMLDIVAKVCDALAFAHSRGVLHCDVKPSNVMVGEFGQVYLMDWGIARLVPTEKPAETGHGTEQAERRARTNIPAIIGTPGYMSPEQAQGHQDLLDVRSDVFLLGALVYEILTRRPPYETGDRCSTLRLAAKGDFPPPKAVVGDGGVAPELERIVLRSMAANPNDRYPTVSAFREDLVRFMRGGAEFPRRTFATGDAIVEEGDAGDAAYIIVTGKCEVVRAEPWGTSVLGTIGPGDVFGEMAIMTEGPRTATVRAIEPTTVLVVTSDALEQEMAALKPWMATLLKSLARRFRQVDTKDRVSRTSKPDL